MECIDKYTDTSEEIGTRGCNSVGILDTLGMLFAVPPLFFFIKPLDFFP